MLFSRGLSRPSLSPLNIFKRVFSERTVYRGSRKIEKGERERKRVADIRKNVDMLRERIQDGKHPEFMKGGVKL